MRRSVVLLLLLVFHALSLGAAAEPAYQYFLTGDSANVAPRTTFGVFLAGGGKDQDAGFEWFLNKAGNGDIVILRASGGDGYNGYLQKLRPQVNSIETILFRSREASSDPAVLEKIRNADGLFLAGGDQWNYIRYWKDSPVEDAIHELVARGVPIGGTSAGLAVLGEFAFSAEHDTVHSPDALADPFHRQVTIATGFLRLPHLGCVITDSHFKQRDRMGRLLVFLARIAMDSPCRSVRGIAIDERTAVLMEARTVRHEWWERAKRGFWSWPRSRSRYRPERHSQHLISKSMPPAAMRLSICRDGKGARAVRTAYGSGRGR